MLQVQARKRLDGFVLQAEFSAPTPGTVALFGRSGCGKTTLVNLISGLLAPDEGRIQLDDTVLTDTRAGISIPAERRRIGYMFQDARLFPHLSVLGNLRYGEKRAARRNAWAARRGAKSDTGRPLDLGDSIGFDGVVELLGLGQLLSRRPHQLSGGERQRVGLGRALLSQPQLLLLDEPLASLDVARREEVLPYLEALRDRLSMPMVYVSHQFEEVLQLATHVVLLEAGKVVAQGGLSEVSLHPQLRAIVGPDSVGSVLDGVVIRTSHGMVELRVGNGTLRMGLQQAEPGSRLRVQLLARDIILATEKPHGLSVRNELEGVVADLSPDDYEAVLVKVDIGGAMVLSRITQEAATELQLRPGSRVWALVKAVSTRGHAFRLPSA
ncbi:MAG TPA: ATP-binding cassette domain-containing protein [Steroidobacteraceae bacterium]|nr:ATP-binding cassette domain-containing protein [Steroidobacteraceae bacterium]